MQDIEAVLEAFGLWLAVRIELRAQVAQQRLRMVIAQHLQRQEILHRLAVIRVQISRHLFQRRRRNRMRPVFTRYKSWRCGNGDQFRHAPG